MAEMQNIYGRKWGRGIRPWLLMPKYLCVALVLGGLAAIAVLGVVGRGDRQAGDLAAAILQYQVFPAIAGATVLGVLLLAHHGRVMLKMRWLWAKLAAVAAAGLVVHGLLKGQVAVQQVSPPSELRMAATVALAAFVMVAVVGRLKPKLGQRYGNARV